MPSNRPLPAEPRRSRTPVAERSVRRTSLRTTLFFETFALLILTVLAVSVTAFFLSWNEFKTRTTSQLQSIAEGKEVLLETTVSRQREQLSILGRDPALRNLPSVTTLVGFKQLLRVDGANISILAGEKSETLLSKELLLSMRGREGTVFRPIVTDAGWTMYVIAAPQTSGVLRIATLVAIFDATSLSARILHTDSAATTVEVLLATRLEEGEVILRADDATDRVVPVRASSDDTLSVVRRALAGEEGVAGGTDYAGIPVLAAFRSVPALGWAVIAKIDRYEVATPTLRLAINLAGTGLMIVVFLSLSTFFLGQRIVGPLEELTKKLDGLEAKHWKFRRSIATGNELEVVDRAAEDLTNRLRTVHDHLEAAVRERTKELAEQLAQDAAILQSMDDGLLVTDGQGMITYVNRMAESLTGFDEMEGKKVQDVLKIFSKDGKELKRLHPVASVLATKKPFRPAADPQFSLQRKDSILTALQIRTTPILRGTLCLGSVTVLRDITEERRIDHMKSEFISLVSHQLRTPLSSMRWYLEMLITEDAGKSSDDQKEYVRQLNESNARMVHLVNALLSVSKIELGTFQVSPESIALPDLIRNIALSFDVESKQKKVTVQLKMPQENVGIRSDRSLLSLIIENFLSNALKYSQIESSVTVTLNEDKKAGMITLSVTDKGIGIPALQQAQIGHKLFRGTNAQSHDTDGNGLGLYISHIAAETIGGTLTFESAEGKGSTFTLKVPKEPRTLEDVGHVIPGKAPGT